MVDPDDYGAYVAAMPSQYQAALMNGDSVSTAFYEARKAGWSIEALIGDGQQCLFGSGGIGALLKRLRGLSEHRPPTPRQVNRPPSYVPRPLTRIRPSFVRERYELLASIRDDIAHGRPVTPVEAEEAMRDLIADQRARAAAEAQS